jgi:nucleoside-diphosphate kinase
MERSCVLIKPDGVGKKVIGEIIKRFESEGLKLVGMKLLKPSKETIEEFYAVHRGKPFFGPFISFASSGPIVACAWEGENAISRIRAIIGATNSKEAAAGTLRNLYGTDNRRNLVHASDSVENGKRESGFFFAEYELMKYDYDDWKDK